MPDKLKKSKSHKDIRYQNQPNGNERCGLCVMFRPPNSCTDVSGHILRNGWCKIFARKK